MSAHEDPVFWGRLLARYPATSVPARDEGAVGRETVTVQTAARASAAARRTLIVLGHGFAATYPLGARGSVTVGRSSDNLVAIDEPAVSRHHLVLHLERDVTLEDLGSANGTRVGGRRLDPGERVRLDPGIPVEIGSAMLIVQDRTVAAAPRRLWSWDYFELRLEEECRRAHRLGSRFLVLHVRCIAPERMHAVEHRLAALLPHLDVVARYVPGEYQVLLTGAEADGAAAAIERLEAALGELAGDVRLGAAEFPADGRSPDPIVAAAIVRASEDAADASESGDGELVAESPAMRELLRMVERLAVDAIPVLLVGETGTGKGRIAEELHRRSGRGDRPLVRIDCTALDPSASWDASAEAWLAQARGGTILLDEICELPAAWQSRLAHLLEDIERGTAGGSAPPRFVATSNRDVEAEVAAGNLRIDLYHRLDGATVVIPPLRQRPEDIAPLAQRFAEDAAARLGRIDAPVVGDPALECLVSYRWPGNVRELGNVVRRAVLLADGPVVSPPHLPLQKLQTDFAAADVDPAPLSDVREKFQEIERQRIVEALDRTSGNQTEAARLLGISRRTLIKRLDLYDLPRPRKK